MVVLHSIDGDHCNLFKVSDNTTACFTTYWAAHGYQFSAWNKGLCPANFNHTDSTNVVCPNSAIALVMGIPQKR